MNLPDDGGANAIEASAAADVASPDSADEGADQDTMTEDSDHPATEEARLESEDPPAPDATGNDPDPESESEPGSEAAAADEQSSPAVAAEPEFRSLKKHHVAPAMIATDRIDDDDTFRVASDGDISQLATDIARLGQLFPVDLRLKPPDRFQVICGFRRMAALRFLQRDRVLARLHTDLTDEDALLMALTSAIHARPVTPDELRSVRGRLEGDGKLTPAIQSMIDKALAPGDDLAPESVDDEQEVEAGELANQVTLRLGEINQDLSLLADVFDALDNAQKDALLEQLRYSADLVTFLEGRR